MHPDGSDEPGDRDAATAAEAAASAAEASAEAAVAAEASAEAVVATAAATEAAAASARHSDRVIEVIAVILLGAGSLLAAWTGYQAARWNSVQAADYVKGSGLRVESAKASTQAGQDRLYDSQVFSQWLNADDAGNTRLAAIYEHRFRAEFRVAFQAWLKTDPFNDPNAPAGPLFMAEYVDASAQHADALEVQAAALVMAGQDANETSDRYVLHAVIFATVLFLAAIADRFRWRPARVGVLMIGTAVLAFGVFGLTQLPIR